MKKNYRYKEQGVVLLSCLVFLLLLLTLLRFNLSSSSIEEMKAGADYDQLNAREAAMLAMRDAEMDIRRIDADGKSLEDASVTGEENIAELARKYWSDPSNFTGAKARRGVVDGDAGGTGCNPSYNCVNWQLTTRNCSATASKTTPACFGDITGILKSPKSGLASMPQTQGAYMIERFKGNGGVLDLEPGNENTLVFRVTAVGFSNDNANSARSRVVLQNTYVYPEN